jgi:hypothetical protein
MTENLLEQLRTAARRREWNELTTTLTRLFMQMEFYAALEIPLRRLHDHLPVFEQHHPEADWARKLLVSVVSFGVAPHALPPEASQPYNSPGSANFLAGVFDMVRSVERNTPVENRVRFAASAVSNAILADLAAFWYEQHPDSWQQQQQAGDLPDPQSGLTVRQQIYAQFWLDSAVAERDTAAWMQVADDIQQKAK